MARSITFELEGHDTERIGTNVPYAKIFQFGSGEYGVGPNAGHTAWTIRPVGKQALSWVFGGKRFFARSVTITGQPSRPFLFFDEPLVDAIKDAFARYVSARR
ncbi:MAG: hypothetical protein IAI48_00370 [Candidatus Eremiobacteraeota bacterium]|nr:hypothetical protein [Candidatus Eremiobacteraeota bacterium]